jgi:hypothetical protein
MVSHQWSPNLILQTPFRVPRWQIHLCTLPPLQFRLRRGQSRPEKKNAPPSHSAKLQGCRLMIAGRETAMVACLLALLSSSSSAFMIRCTCACRRTNLSASIANCHAHGHRHGRPSMPPHLCLAKKDAFALSLSRTIMALPKREGRDLFLRGGSSMP